MVLYHIPHQHCNFSTDTVTLDPNNYTGIEVSADWTPVCIPHQHHNFSTDPMALNASSYTGTEVSAAWTPFHIPHQWS